MRERYAGLIMDIASKAAVTPDEAGAAARGAKHGLDGAGGGAVRFEEKQNGIRTCVVCPGFTDTEIAEKRLVPTPEMLAKALRPEDVAEMVVAVAQLPARTWVPVVHIFPADI